MEQRQIREALEKLMRESRQQMNTLGRLDDVIDEMKDLETQALDPAMRRKVAERQKKIYERMLKAQKSVKNRDEESEERKARKAREIVQQQPDKPIGDIGSDTLDLSKDFLTDLKEEFPDDYKQMLNDYYRSLNIYGDGQ
jgi:flagellar biosynthesis GTPase FlhF